MEARPKAIGGVDIGGTNVKIALVDPKKEQVLMRSRIKTSADKGPDDLVAEIGTTINQLSRETEQSGFLLAGVGVGCAGVIDLVTGAVITSPNLPDWKGFPLAHRLQQRIQTPVYVANDVDCIGLGEYWLGAGRDLGDFLGIAPGTGVGGCLIIGGKIWTGIGSSAAEIGHTTIQPDGEKCLCGNRGCLETLASASWLVQRATENLRHGTPSSLERYVKTPEGLTAESIYREAVAGDGMAQELFNLVGTSMAIAIANVVHMLGIQSVLIAGGVANGWEAFIGSLHDELARRLTMLPSSRVKVVKAQLDDEAGSLGGVYFAANQLGLL